MFHGSGDEVLDGVVVMCEVRANMRYACASSEISLEIN